MASIARPEEDRAERPKVLKTKFQIGSCKAPLNYGNDETVFHASDIPAHKLAAKRQVRADTRRDVLGLRAPKWNSSTETPEPACMRPRCVISEFDRSDRSWYNYRAEVLPPSQPKPVPKQHKFKVSTVNVFDVDGEGSSRQAASRERTAEMPVHPNLAGKPAWNNATFMGAPEKRALVRRSENARQRNSERAGRRLRGYQNPVQLHRAAVERQREAKRRPAPAPVKERLGADGLPLRLQLNTTSRKYKKWRHTGAWEFQEREGRHVWSCCMAEGQDSRGCVPRVYNPDAMVVCGP